MEVIGSLLRPYRNWVCVVVMLNMANVTVPLRSLREQCIFCVKLQTALSEEVPSIEKATHVPCRPRKGSKLGTSPIVRFETKAHRFGVSAASQRPHA